MIVRVSSQMFPTLPLVFLTIVTLAPGLSASPHDKGVCTLIPKGNGRDDSEQLLAAVASPDCKEILLPQPYTYTIQQRLRTDLTDKVLNVYGTLSVSDILQRRSF